MAEPVRAAATLGPNISTLMGSRAPSVRRIERTLGRSAATQHPEAFHFDSKVDPATALRLVDGRVTLVGNVNNPGTLLLGDPEEVRREVRSILDAGIRVVGPECAVPMATLNRNLAAILTSGGGVLPDQ